MSVAKKPSRINPKWICRDCGGQTRDPRSVRCKPCDSKAKKTRRYCLDCGKEILSNKAKTKRCGPCAGKERWWRPGFRKRMEAVMESKAYVENQQAKHKKSKYKILLRKLREHKRYAQWKNDVLLACFGSLDSVPPNIQVHHKIHVAHILKENNVNTIEEALLCPAVWDIDNGQPLFRNEHLVLHQIERRKTPPSPEFLKWVTAFVKRNRGRAIDLEPCRRAVSLSKERP